MKNSLTLCSLLLALVPLSTGCKSVLLPTDNNYQPQNTWQTYEQALAAFDKIVPHQTSVHDLCGMGFDPTNSPNMKVMTYLDVIQRFLPNQSVTKADMPNDVRYCLEAKDAAGAMNSLSTVRSATLRQPPARHVGFKKNNADHWFYIPRAAGRPE